MTYINIEEVRKLAKHSLPFAMLMEDEEIEAVIATFVCVLNRRRKRRGDQGHV